MATYKPAKFGDGLDLEGGARTITFSESLNGDFTLSNWIVPGAASTAFNDEIVRLENTVNGDYITLRYSSIDSRFYGEYRQGDNKRVIASPIVSFSANDFVFYAIKKDSMHIGIQNRDVNGVVTQSLGPYKF